MTVLEDLGETETDVVVVNLTDLEEKRLNITLNKVRGRWDFEKLSELLGSLDDTSLTGFSEWEIDALNTDYDHISDLLEDDFTDLKDPSEQKTFTMTFVLPERDKESVNNFIASTENAKEVLAELIVQKAQGLI